MAKFRCILGFPILCLSSLLFAQNKETRVGQAPTKSSLPEFSQTSLFTEGVYSQSTEFSPQIISMLWEGRDFSGANTIALKRIRKRWPDLRLVHFISPSYFLRSDKLDEKMGKKVKNLILSDEKICLLIHPWESILKRAGVTPQHKETFWGYQLNSKRCLADCGQEVPLNNYDIRDQEKIIAISSEIFKSVFGEAPSCFMAGAWLSGPDLWPVLRKLGIKHDFSYVNIALLKDKLIHYPLWKILEDNWGREQKFSTKKFLVLTEFGSLNIWPMSAATLSYSTPQKIGQIYESYKKSTLEKSGHSDQEEIFHFGLYMDTLGRYEDEANEILAQILK